MPETPLIEVLEGQQKGGCPVVNLDFNQPLPIHSYHEELDRIRALSPIVWNTYGGGFWMLLNDETVRDAFPDHQVFSSEATIPTVPDHAWPWLPTLEHPPKHKLYRRVLQAHFTPPAIRDSHDRLRPHTTAITEPPVAPARLNFPAALPHHHP